jgi:hypothetical protein
MIIGRKTDLEIAEYELDSEEFLFLVGYIAFKP